MQSQGDRFISHRSLVEDSATLFNKKVELFSSLMNSPTRKSRHDQDMDDEDQVQNQQPKEDMLQIEEENKKTYRALL